MTQRVSQLWFVARRISVVVDGRLFFKRLSWQMACREQWAILGPNGAGKTLLGRVLLGQVPLLEGEFDFPLAEQEPDIQMVSFESQQQMLAGDEAYYQARWEASAEGLKCTVDQWLSRAQVLTINPFEVLPPEEMPGLYKRHRQQVVAQLELRPLLNRQLHQLSNGETRKVLLARALLRQPDLLILDDPFSGLDIKSRLRLRKILSKLIMVGVPLLLIARRREELPRGITHVLVLRAGKVVAKGTRRKVLTLPVVKKLYSNPKSLTPIPKKVLAPEKNRFASEPRVPLLQMTDVSVQYGHKKILNHFTWTMRRKEQWVLLGPNGAGKSTLISLILGDNPKVYANDIYHFGRRLGSDLSVWELRSLLGYVSPELQAYHPAHVTVREVVTSGLFDTIGLYHQPNVAQRRQVGKCLKEFELLAGADEMFGSLSAGLQRMALLARAIIKHPPLLLLDEPCQGLDAHNRHRVLAMIELLGRKPGCQFLFVTHQKDEIPTCTTHVLKLSGGKAQMCLRAG